MQGGLFYLVTVGAVGAFHIQHTDQSENSVAAGGDLVLTCTASGSYEYCSWSHSPGNRECHLEWKRIKNGVIMQDCHSELKHKVSISGDYKSHECGIQISGFEARDAGTWTCEMEKYVFLGKRGSGNRDSRIFAVGLLTTTTTTTTTSTTSTFPTTNTSTSSSSPATTTTPSMTVMTGSTSADSVTTEPVTEEEDSTDQDRTREETTELSNPDQEEKADLDGESTNVTEKFVQSDEETGGSTSSMVGLICGVVLVVLAAGAVAAVLGWRRRQNRVQTVTMSKLIEEGEAKGILLEENEVTARQTSQRSLNNRIFFTQFNNPPVDRVLINSLP